MPMRRKTREDLSLDERIAIDVLGWQPDTRWEWWYTPEGTQERLPDFGADPQWTMKLLEAMNQSFEGEGLLAVRNLHWTGTRWIVEFLRLAPFEGEYSLERTVAGAAAYAFDPMTPALPPTPSNS